LTPSVSKYVILKAIFRSGIDFEIIYFKIQFL